MITKITMNGVASFKHSTELITDKKVNLIYGLNGTGKSTISNYLYDKTNAIYANCKTDSVGNEKILVYNQRFIEDNFYGDTPSGIFTLSKENKQSEEKIKQAEIEIKKIEDDKIKLQESLNRFETELADSKTKAEIKIWEIKNNYAGGDRVLEYCLDGLKGKKETLLNYILNISKLDKVSKTIQELKNEISAISDSTAQKCDEIQEIDINVDGVEKDLIFQKSILGKKDSPISDFIDRFHNSDWIKKGFDYISDEKKICPFCQRLITDDIVNNMKSYFDVSYENDINTIKKLLETYNNQIITIKSKDTYKINRFINEKYSEFESLYGSLMGILENNKTLIANKINSPSKSVNLTPSKNSLILLNQFISNINQLISEYNKKLDNKDKTRNQIKDFFWQIMRLQYDTDITIYYNDKSRIEVEIKNKKDAIDKMNEQIIKQKDIILEQQKNTVNIELAVNNINTGLLELGIDSFSIQKDSDVLYKIVRANDATSIFKTISEGEKMIISFLYFIELCKGKQDVADVNLNKIIVIDDPISSLSHIYVFNIGELIKRNFTKPDSNYKQVFLLTHSLYFFYELTFIKKEEREKYQKLFRIIKNRHGADIQDMHYQEIQNDYQSYWQVIKDKAQAPALIANCMRNIIEYFFNFIEKIELSNVFQKPSLRDIKYQAFYRYMNRESHSLGQNIFDTKEFDYDIFREAFEMIFKETGYENHYNKMNK